MHMQVMQPPVAKRHWNDGLVPVFQVAESVATSTAQSTPPFKAGGQLLSAGCVG